MFDIQHGNESDMCCPSSAVNVARQWWC